MRTQRKTELLRGLHVRESLTTLKETTEHLFREHTEIDNLVITVGSDIDDECREHTIWVKGNRYSDCILDWQIIVFSDSEGNYFSKQPVVTSKHPEVFQISEELHAAIRFDALKEIVGQMFFMAMMEYPYETSEA